MNERLFSSSEEDLKR